MQGLLRRKAVGTVKKQAEPTVFEVVVSFDGLNKGERFTQQPDNLGWALMHVENGYLKIVGAPDGDEGQG